MTRKGKVNKAGPVSFTPPNAALRTVASLGRLNLSLLAAITTELRDAALAFQGPTETPAQAGQRATRLRAAVELATDALDRLTRSGPKGWGIE